MIVVVMVTVCACDALQKFLFIMLELCLVPHVAYYARFSACLICGCLAARQLFVYTKNSSRKCYVNPNTISMVGQSRYMYHTIGAISCN